jgi:hypothetical protein
LNEPKKAGGVDSVRIDLLKGRQPNGSGSRSRAIKSQGHLIIKIKAMEKGKTSGFVNEVVQEMYDLVGNDLAEEKKEKLAVSIGLSLKQSFLNGIEVGLKKRQDGQDRPNKKPYRNYRR